MEEPVFLTLQQVMSLHNEQITEYGGSHGIRDTGLLQSSCAMPQASFGGRFLHPTLEEMAAAYLYHLVMNHPFIDGNKRVGAMASFVFLKMNKITLVADPDDYADLVLSTANGKIGKPEISAFIKGNTK